RISVIVSPSLCLRSHDVEWVACFVAIGLSTKSEPSPVTSRPRSGTPRSFRTAAAELLRVVCRALVMRRLSNPGLGWQKQVVVAFMRAIGRGREPAEIAD